MYEFLNTCQSYSVRGCGATEYYIVKPNGQIVFVANGEKRPRKFRVPDEYAVVKVYTTTRGNLDITVLNAGIVGEERAKKMILDYLTEDVYIA